MLHLIVDNGSQINFVSKEIVKKLGLVTTPRTQPYKIDWMKDGQELRITQVCKISYFIKPFWVEVLCDMAPLLVVDVLVRKSDLWDKHRNYQSKPHKVIVNIGMEFLNVNPR